MVSLCFFIYVQLLLFYLFGVLHCFQHCTGHITKGSWKGRGNQYIQFVRVLYCKLPTNVKQLPAFPLQAMPGTEPQPQRWTAGVLPLCRRGPPYVQLHTPVKSKVKLHFKPSGLFPAFYDMNHLTFRFRNPQVTTDFPT